MGCRFYHCLKAQHRWPLQSLRQPSEFWNTMWDLRLYAPTYKSKRFNQGWTYCTVKLWPHCGHSSKIICRLVSIPSSLSRRTAVRCHGHEYKDRNRIRADPFVFAGCLKYLSYICCHMFTKGFTWSCFHFQILLKRPGVISKRLMY